ARIARPRPFTRVRLAAGAVAPAGANDITARLIGQWLSERLKDHCCDLLGAIDADPGAEHPAARAVATRLMRCQSEAPAYHASTDWKWCACALRLVENAGASQSRSCAK